MKKFLTLVAVSCMFTAGPAMAAGDAAAGKAKSAVCAACHGADGNSTNPVWPKLAGQNERYLVKQLQAFKGGEQRANALMAPMVANLSEQDMEDLAAYFASQPASGGYTSEERMALGKKIFHGGNGETGVAACMSCHGPDGSGNPLAGFPALAGQHAVYTASQLRAFRDGTRTSDPNEMMRYIGGRITDEEIDAVAEYAAGLY